jgi:hypothetical protein
MKSSFPILRRRAAALVSVYVRMKSADAHGTVGCITCGIRGPWKDFDSGHFLPGRANSIANLLDERGQHPQCRTCNRLRYGAPELYEQIMESRYGKAEIDRLRQQKRTHKKYTSADLRELIKSYRVKIKALSSMEYGDFVAPRFDESGIAIDG